MITPTSNDETIENALKDEGPVQKLLRITRDPRGSYVQPTAAYAQVAVGGHRELYPLSRRAFRRWLIARLPTAIVARFRSDWAIRRVLEALEAIAWVPPATSGRSSFESAATPTETARPITSIWATPAGGPSGSAPRGGRWSKAPDDLRRPEGLSAPPPSREGSIELLRPYVNLTESDFRLLIVWMAAAIRPFGPYPVLALHGDKARPRARWPGSSGS